MKERNKMIYEVEISNEKYNVIITKKKIKRIIIKVNFKKEILVSCPLALSYNDVLKEVFKNSNWIENNLLKKQKIIDKFSIDKYYNNEIIYLKGNVYSLIQDENLKENYKIIDNNLFYKSNLNKTIQVIYKSFFHLIESEFYIVLEMFKHLIKQKPSLSIKIMKSRWGSCNYQTGKIVINKMLIAVPNELLHYVMVHEFVHLLFPNHSYKYYECLEKFIPNYKSVEKRLKEYSFLLHS